MSDRKLLRCDNCNQETERLSKEDVDSQVVERHSLGNRVKEVLATVILQAHSPAFGIGEYRCTVCKSNRSDD